MKFFALISALGLGLSMVAHVSTFFGIDPEQPLPYIWFLHLGIFVVMVPAIVVQPGKREGRAVGWRDTMGNASAWLRWLTILLVANAFINWAAFWLVCGSGGPTQEPNGTYSLSSHGRIIRQITAAEYHRARGYEFRGFSSWWMLCYSLALTLLMSQINRRKMADEPVVPKTLSGASPFALQYPLQGGVAMPIWLHRTMLLFCIMFGWIGVPFLAATYVLPLLGKFLWYWNGLFFLCSWVVGVTVPATLLRRHVPACCPRCGGRAYCQSLIEMNYLCIDCGYTHIGT
jgi:hypothetical protein